MNRDIGRSLLALTLALGLAAPLTAAAQDVVTQDTLSTRTEQLQRAQEAQIQQAMAAGQLDARYAQRLLRAAARIQHAQERAYADGLLTLREQRRLARAQSRLQRHIDRATQAAR